MDQNFQDDNQVVVCEVPGLRDAVCSSSFLQLPSESMVVVGERGSSDDVKLHSSLGLSSRWVHDDLFKELSLNS